MTRGLASRPELPQLVPAAKQSNALLTTEGDTDSTSGRPRRRQQRGHRPDERLSELSDSAFDPDVLRHADIRRTLPGHA